MQSTTSSPGNNTNPSHDAGGLVGFFAHHGVWAPGIRLFRNLNFRSKALLISALFMLPIGVLSTLYLRQATAITSFAEREQVGVGYAKEVLQLLSQLRLQRQRVVQGAAAGSAGASDIAQTIREQLRRLEAVEKRTLGSSGDTRGTDAIEVLRANIDKALNQPAASPLAAYKRLTQAIDAAFALLETVVDRSGLAVDPDLDTKYLIQVGLTQLPRVAGSALAQGDLAMAVARGASRPMAVAFMAPQRAIGDYLDSQIRQALDNVNAILPEFGKRVSYASTQEGLNTLQAHGALVGEEDAKIDPAAVAAAIQSMTERAALLEKQLLGELEPLIQARVDRVSRETWLLGSLLLASLLLVFYMFRSFSNVVQGGLWEVRRHLTAMTDGDLTTVPQPWGKDEAARLMLTLRTMQDALRDIVMQVRQASEGIVEDSRTISGSALELSSCTEQNAASLQTSSMAMDQIGNVVRETADRAAEATAIGRDNVDAAERGGQVIGQVITTMHDIHAASSKISEIISVIDGIAFQTNILALNAAVEAALAGDTGRGFAVVASEVRSLARRSATAAHEIKALINSSVAKVTAGTGVVEQAGAVIGEIVASSHRANVLLEGMASSIRDQAKSVTEVGQSVVEVNNATQHNAVLVEQTAHAASALQSQANVLAQRVARFQLPG